MAAKVRQCAPGESISWLPSTLRARLAALSGGDRARLGCVRVAQATNKAYTPAEAVPICLRARQKVPPRGPLSTNLAPAARPWPRWRSPACSPGATSPIERQPGRLRPRRPGFAPSTRARSPRTVSRRTAAVLGGVSPQQQSTQRTLLQRGPLCVIWCLKEARRWATWPADGGWQADAG